MCVAWTRIYLCESWHLSHCCMTKTCESIWGWESEHQGDEKPIQWLLTLFYDMLREDSSSNTAETQLFCHIFTHSTWWGYAIFEEASKQKIEALEYQQFFLLEEPIREDINKCNQQSPLVSYTCEVYKPLMALLLRPGDNYTADKARQWKLSLRQYSPKNGFLFAWCPPHA